jgi:tungstate transport system ATP-binding protein
MLYELHRFGRVYQDRAVLDVHHLVIEAGKITGLIGANGAGKTTLLQLLAFLEMPSRGTIAFRGQPVEYREDDLLGLRRQVVLVDQYPILFTGSVRRNLEFGLKIRGIERGERERRILSALELVGMGGFLYARAEKLSGGETKRIALARALALRPAVLLCDEPTANVDGEHQEVILNILERANSDEHISIVFSTHDLEQAERLADTLVTLKDGQLSRLSRVNVWHATIVDGQVAVIAGRGQSEVKIVLPQPVSLRHGTTRRRLFLDPERLVLLPPEAEAGEGQLLPATVVQLVADQGRVRVTVDIGIPVDVYLTTNIYAQRPPCIGEPFLLQIAAASLAIE